MPDLWSFFLFAFLLQLLHHLWLVKGQIARQRSSHRDVRQKLDCLTPFDPLSSCDWIACLAPTPPPSCPPPTQSHAACQLLWHHQLLTFVAVGYQALLYVNAHAGSLCSPQHPTFFHTKFSLIFGVTLSLQCFQYTSDVLRRPVGSSFSITHTQTL